MFAMGDREGQMPPRAPEGGAKMQTDKTRYFVEKIFCLEFVIGQNPDAVPLRPNICYIGEFSY